MLTALIRFAVDHSFFLGAFLLFCGTFAFLVRRFNSVLSDEVDIIRMYLWVSDLSITGFYLRAIRKLIQTTSSLFGESLLTLRSFVTTTRFVVLVSAVLSIIYLALPTDFGRHGVSHFSSTLISGIAGFGFLLIPSTTRRLLSRIRLQTILLATFDNHVFRKTLIAALYLIGIGYFIFWMGVTGTVLYQGERYSRVLPLSWGPLENPSYSLVIDLDYFAAFLAAVSATLAFKTLHKVPAVLVVGTLIGAPLVGFFVAPLLLKSYFGEPYIASPGCIISYDYRWEYKYTRPDDKVVEKHDKVLIATDECTDEDVENFSRRRQGFPTHMGFGLFGMIFTAALGISFILVTVNSFIFILSIGITKYFLRKICMDAASGNLSWIIGHIFVDFLAAILLLSLGVLVLGLGTTIFFAEWSEAVSRLSLKDDPFGQAFPISAGLLLPLLPTASHLIVTCLAVQFLLLPFRRSLLRLLNVGTLSTLLRWAISVVGSMTLIVSAGLTMTLLTFVIYVVHAQGKNLWSLIFDASTVLI